MKYLALVFLIIPFVANAKPDHSTWDELLQEHVTVEGKVDYKGFEKDKERLNEYLRSLKRENPYGVWSKNEKLAYWINVYNAFTVKAILDYYPVSSITHIKPKNANTIWKLKWIEIAGKQLSLDEIENDIIRPEFKDARIHFAVNCAAKSCPPLRNKAYTADRLNEQLNEQTRKFINDKSMNKIDANKAEISNIFYWYADDFKLVEFINKYSGVKITESTKITYLEYDWELNEK
ncbi:MAG: DUF547 domain-containing protein [Bacteroidia bacterium]